MIYPVLMWALLGSVAAIAEPIWKDFPMVVPATEKEGHRYMIEVDTDKNGKPKHAVIAVAIHNSEILFTEFDDKESNKDNCAEFYSPRGGQRYCNNQFFLLHADFMRTYRVTFMKNGETNPSCPKENIVKFQDSVLMMDKPDRSSADKPKYIGTYFLRKDQFSFLDQKKDKRETLNRLKNKIGDVYAADRFEVFCRDDYKFAAKAKE